MTHSALEANRAVALSATLMHTEGGNSMHTNGIAACIARDTERDRSKAMGVSTRARDLRPVLTKETRAHTHTHIPPVQQHSSQPYDRVR